MMKDVIEIVARGVCAAGNIFESDGDIWDEGKQQHIKGWTLYNKDAQAALSAITAAGYAVVPVEPSEAQWGGLARSLMMGLDMDCRTPRKMFKHLKQSGVTIPQWLRDEVEMQNLDHVVSKGTRVVIIYKAMIAAAQATGEGDE